MTALLFWPYVLTECALLAVVAIRHVCAGIRRCAEWLESFAYNTEDTLEGAVMRIERRI